MTYVQVLFERFHIQLMVDNTFPFPLIRTAFTAGIRILSLEGGASLLYKFAVFLWTIKDTTKHFEEWHNLSQLSYLNWNNLKHMH